MSKSFVMRTDKHKQFVAARILAMDLTRPLEISVDLYKPRRTTSQNALMWKWHAEVAADLNAYTNKSWTAEKVHYEIFCPRFLGGEPVQLPDGTEVFHSHTSSSLNKQEMSDAMTKYQVWCIDANIELTVPDED